LEEHFFEWNFPDNTQKEKLYWNANTYDSSEKISGSFYVSSSREIINNVQTCRHLHPFVKLNKLNVFLMEGLVQGEIRDLFLLYKEINDQYPVTIELCKQITCTNGAPQFGIKKFSITCDNEADKHSKNKLKYQNAKDTEQLFSYLEISLLDKNGSVILYLVKVLGIIKITNKTNGDNHAVLLVIRMVKDTVDLPLDKDIQPPKKRRKQHPVPKTIIQGVVKYSYEKAGQNIDIVPLESVVRPAFVVPRKPADFRVKETYNDNSSRNYQTKEFYHVPINRMHDINNLEEYKNTLNTNEDVNLNSTTYNLFLNQQEIAAIDQIERTERFVYSSDTDSNSDDEEDINKLYTVDD